MEDVANSRYHAGRNDGRGGEDLDAALDLLHSLVRREQQREVALRDLRNSSGAAGVYSVEIPTPSSGSGGGG
jgi:hypothetical protein